MVILENNTLKRIICVILLGGVVSMVLFCLLIKWSVERTKTYYGEINFDMQSVQYDIENVEKTTDGYLCISGWSVFHGESIQEYNTHIILQNIRDNEFVQIPTMMVIREDITERFHKADANENFNYDKSGWQAKVNLKKLSMPFDEYKVIILYQNNGKNVQVDTGEFLEMGVE